MTKDEAVTEVEMLNWGGISFKTEEVIALINQQAEQIEKLRCCGNCGNWLNMDELCQLQDREDDAPRKQSYH